MNNILKKGLDNSSSYTSIYMVLYRLIILREIAKRDYFTIIARENQQTKKNIVL